jgi:Holliday junction DNA helicase RuvA
MISFLQGTIAYRGDTYVIVDAGGVGYRVIVSPKVLNILSKEHEKVNPVALFIHSQLNMREGTFDLYGFMKHEDLDLFHLLTSVSGIGPKNAMGIMANVEPQHLKAAVVNEDAQYLRKVSGIGQRVAQRLVVELAGKVDHLDIGGASMDLDQESQAMEALLALGYSQYQATETLKEAKGTTLQERVREALKLLSKK